MWPIMQNLQRKFAVVLLLAVVLIAVVWACSPALLGLLADHYYAQTNQAKDAEVAKLVDRLASLGTPAIPRLTSALGSERRVVAQSVRARLIKMIESWENPETRPTPQARLTLAGSLATRMNQYGPGARLHATTLARQMLRAPTSGMTQKEAQQLTLACETILRVSKLMAKKDHPASEEAFDGSVSIVKKSSNYPIATHVTSSVHGKYAEDNAPLSEQSLVELARLPGGALPLTLPELSSRRLTPEEGGGRETVPLARSAAKPPGSPLSGLPAGSSFQKLPLQANSSLNKDPNSPAREPSSDPRRLPDDPSIRPLNPASDGTVAATSPRTSSSEKPSDRVYSLIMQLHAGDPEKAKKARRELTNGGFKTVHFALAERMTDSDPAVRKELAGILPRLKSVQTRLWLKWLLKDDDPGVRREALATLSSSSDPMLLAEIAEIARSDADPKIRLAGERIESRLTK